MTQITEKPHAALNGGYKDATTVVRQQETGQMWLIVQGREDTKRTVQISADRFVIGRRPDCDLVLADRQISGRHAQLERHDGRVFLRDLESTNGTAVNGRRIHGAVELAGGEEIRVGETMLTLGVARPEKTAFAPIPEAPPPPQQPPPPAPAPAQQPEPEFRQRSRSSVMERIQLRRNTNRAIIAAAVSGVVALAAIVLAATGVFSGSDDKPTVGDVVKTVTPSTLLVTAETDGKSVEKGTAWVLDAKRGLLVTNNHVAQGGERLKVSVGGTSTAAAQPAKIVGAAPCEDIAVLQVTGMTGLKTLPLASSAEAGDGVVALGFPANASPRDNLIATSGVVSAVHSEFSPAQTQAIDVPDLTDVLQTDAAINPGNSGGPLVNYDSRLVGMNTAVLDESGDRTLQNQGYAISAERVKSITDKLKTGQSIGWAGFGFDYPTDDQRRQFNLPAGMYVSHVESGSPAASMSAFNSGSVVLTAINGKALDGTLKSYCDAVKDVSAGESATVSYVDVSDTLFTTTQSAQVRF